MRQMQTMYLQLTYYTENQIDYLTGKTLITKCIINYKIDN